MVSGNLRYGDSALVAATGRAPCETLQMCNEEKRVCVVDSLDPTDHLDQGFVQILQVVRGFYADPLPIDGCP